MPGMARLQRCFDRAAVLVAEHDDQARPLPRRRGGVFEAGERELIGHVAGRAADEDVQQILMRTIISGETRLSEQVRIEIRGA